MDEKLYVMLVTNGVCECCNSEKVVLRMSGKTIFENVQM